MTTNERLRKIINWLIYRGAASNERELAERLGYTKSSFSQLVNGKVPLTDRFVGKLCALDANINSVWIMSGDGSMFLSDPAPASAPSTVEIPTEAWRVITLQAESLSARDRQIDELIDLMKKSDSEPSGVAGVAG